MSSSYKQLTSLQCYLLELIDDSSVTLDKTWSSSKLNSKFNALENKYVRSTRFEIISSGTSGQVTIAGTQSVILDDFGGTTDAIISKVDSGKPTFEAATTTTGDIIATTFDESGNYVLTDTPSSYPVAIIYRVREQFIDFNESDNNLIGDLTYEDHQSRISSNDTSAGFLETKLVSGSGISLTVLNEGLNESLQVGISDTLFDDEVGIILKDVPCHTSVYVKAAVRFDAAGMAYNALADDISTSNVVGIVVSKSQSDLCNIRVSGFTSSIFSSLDETKVYYLSDTVAGEIGTSVPTAVGHVVVKVGQPRNTNQLIVNPEIKVVRA